MLTMEYIASQAESLVQQHGSRDPAAICNTLGIHLRFRDLGASLKAYYFCQSRIRVITVNNREDEYLQRVLLAHELGHDQLHRGSAMQEFSEMELFDLSSPYEYQANLFASALLIDDEILLGLLNDDLSFFGAAKELAVPPELLDFKFRLLKRRGYHMEPLNFARADFLRQ